MSDMETSEGTVTENKLCFGRRGDPRMHKAVAARMNDNALTLTGALRQGGFDVTHPEDATEDEKKKFASKLAQRKNQLSRRLRLMRQKMTDGVNNSGASDDSFSKNEFKKKKRKKKDTKSCKSHTTPCIPIVQSGDPSLQSLKNPMDIMMDHPEFNSEPTFNEIGLSESLGHSGNGMNSTNLQSPPSTLFGVNNFTNIHNIHTQNNMNIDGVPNQQQNYTSQQQQQGEYFRQSTNTNPDSSTFVGIPSQEGGSFTTFEQFDRIRNVQYAMATSQSYSLDGQPMDSKTAKSLQIYRSGVTNFIRQCMIEGGFSSEQTEETDPTYIKFAGRALDLEARRIASLREFYSNSLSGVASRLASQQQNLGSQQTGAQESQYLTSNNGYYSNFGSINNNTTTTESTHQNNGSANLNHACNHDNNVSTMHSIGHQHHHQVTSATNNKYSGATNNSQYSNNNDGNKSCFNGRHLHRLSGKCGHKPIIHIPMNGKPHVDFIVDGKVECFEDVYPVLPDDQNPTQANRGAVWPSRFSCEELHCSNQNQYNDSHQIKCGVDECVQDCVEYAPQVPKLFDIHEIDLDGDEWRLNLDEQTDEVVNSLFSLGE